MKTKSLFVGVAISALLIQNAKADFYDNFDSYADSTAFGAAWTDTVGTGLELNTAEFVSGPNSVKNPGTTAQQSRIAMPNKSATDISFSFSFYDYSTANARDYGMVYSRAGGGAWTDGLNNLLAIGKFNTIAGTRYYGRVSTATGGIYGDGASTPASTWFQLGIGVSGYPVPSVGWHTAEITGTPDPINSGKVIYKFYIDGILGGSVANLNSVDYNWVVLGSGLSTAPSGIAFDDVTVSSVPEPSAFAFTAVALGALVAIRRFRK